MFKKTAAVTILLLAASGAIAAEYVDPAANFVSTRSRAEVSAEVVKGAHVKAETGKTGMRTSGKSNAGTATAGAAHDDLAMKPTHLRFID